MSFVALRLVPRNQEGREDMGFFLSFSQATAVPDRSSRGRERVTERWWPSGTRGGGSREKEKAGVGEGGEQREKDASISPRLGPLASFPEEFVFTPLNKNRLVLVPPGKNRQIQEYLCLQRIYGDLALSPQTPGDSLCPVFFLGYSPASVPAPWETSFPSPISRSHGDPSVPAS